MKYVIQHPTSKRYWSETVRDWVDEGATVFVNHNGERVVREVRRMGWRHAVLVPAPQHMLPRPGYERRIRNVFIDAGDACDCVAVLERQGMRPRVYVRTVRAELKSVLVHTVVADTKL